MAATNYPTWVYDPVNPPLLVQSPQQLAALQAQGVYGGSTITSPPTPVPLPQTAPPSPAPTFVLTDANSAVIHNGSTKGKKTGQGGPSSGQGT